jgi:glycosyltransferase involved in cell wall biosynthesis
LKVDVAMCTWNSKKPWLKQCLASIKREIPSCHLIVVDRFSDDGTVEVVKRFFPEALIIESETNLGKARQEAIRHIDTDWFVFVDDDVELCNGWFSKITSNLTRDTGAIAGFTLPTLEWLKKLSLYNNASGFQRVVPAIYLSNTLVRTNLVRDWSPPSFISSGEDMHLSQYITKKGYTMIILNELHVKHHGQWGLSNAEKDLWHYSGARLVGYPRLTTRRLARKLCTSPLNGALASLKLKEPLIMPYMTLSEFYRLKGWLQWNKYRVLKR